MRRLVMLAICLVSGCHADRLVESDPGPVQVGIRLPGEPGTVLVDSPTLEGSGLAADAVLPDGQRVRLFMEAHAESLSGVERQGFEQRAYSGEALSYEHRFTVTWDGTTVLQAVNETRYGSGAWITLILSPGQIAAAAGDPDGGYYQTKTYEVDPDRFAGDDDYNRSIYESVLADFAPVTHTEQARQGRLLQMVSQSPEFAALVDTELGGEHPDILLAARGQGCPAWVLSAAKIGMALCRWALIPGPAQPFTATACVAGWGLFLACFLVELLSYAG